jgi:phosphatidylglycerol lysyltransferase
MLLLALVPAAVLLVCSVSSDMVALTGGDPIGIWGVLPAGPVAGDWVNAEVSSTAFLLVAIALFRAKRLGFWMALAMITAGLVVQGATLDHPASMVAGVVVGAILVATRSRYRVGSGRRETVIAAWLLGGGVVFAALAALASANGADVPGTVGDAVGSVLDLATPVGLHRVAALGAILIVGRVAYVVASVLVLDPQGDDRSPDEVAAARRTLREVGSGGLFPYQNAPECTAWADAAGTAAIAVARVGRTEVALGDPAGEPSATGALLDSWIDRSKRRDVVPMVYQASAGLAATLRSRRWTTVPVGREAVLDPTRFDLGTPRMANLRHTITRSRRGGVTTVWSPEGLAGLSDPSLIPGLVRLDEAWRKGVGPEMGFTVGRFDASDTRPSAIAVAVDAAGEPIAFAVLRPTGSDGGWMLDVMRRTRQGVPGALESAVATAIEALGAVGVHRFSLGLAPLAGLERSSPDRAERLLALAARLIRPLYNTEGLAFFKDKFAPEWQPRFLAVPGPLALSTAGIALLRLHLGGDWGRVVRSVASGLAPAGRTVRIRGGASG